MVKKGTKVLCDVCRQPTKKIFYAVLVYKTNYEDRYIQQSMSDCEKYLDVCHKCIVNLNFRSVKTDKVMS